MTAYTWIGGTGNWKTAGNWSPAGPPTATDTATISATGAAYTVMINSADVAQSLTESSSSATVDDTGSLTLSSTFTLSAGTFILDAGGTLSGGTTKLTGGTFACEGGTLSNVTYDGTLDLSEFQASVYIAGGTVVNNAAGTGAGTINDTGYGSALYFDNTQTFNNATINLGATNHNYYSYLYEYDVTGAGTVLTLGSNVTINESGYAEIADGGHAGDGIVNQGAIKQSGAGSYLSFSGNSLTNSGTITAASSGGTLTIYDTTFTNSGTLAISNGDNVTIEPTNFTNAAAGVISIGANSTLTLAPPGSWSNQGSITLASGSSLYLGGSFTYTGLGKLTNSGGTLYIEGTFTNTGRLNGTNALGAAVLYGGTIQGGIAALAGLAFSSHGGTLSGVTYDGALNLTGSYVSVSLANGTVVNNAFGTGAGTINDTGNGGTLNFDNTQTFNNVTINLGAATGSSSYISFIEEYDTTGAGTVLTLGSNVTIDERGYAQIADSGASGDGIVNQGAIKQLGTSSQLTFTGNSLTNSGTISGASNNGGVTIDDTTFTNTGTIMASASGGTLTIDPTTFTNSGAINISNGDNATIEPTNFTNAAKGVIAVGASSTLNLTVGGSWSNLGSITLASGSSLYLGGSFTVASLGSIANSGGTVYVEGTLNNTGGTLNGSNVLGQAALDGGTVQGGTATSTGLVLSAGGGTLSGVTYDGTLDLSGVFNSVNLTGGTVVNNAAGTGAGTINDTGFDSILYFDNTQTFNNATVNLGNTSGYYSFISDTDLTGAGTVLTLGSNVTINESGYGFIADSGFAGDGIVNQGAITQSGTGSYLVINGNSLTNSGTISGASSDGALAIYDTTFTNSGTLAVSNGDILAIGATNFTNTGSINLASGSSLYLGGSFTLAELGTVNNSGGGVYIGGTLNLTGGTLNASSGLGPAVLEGGTVNGGTVTSFGLALFASSGTLSGVTYDGTLDLSEAQASVQLANGTVVNNAAGTGAGTINDTGEGSYLYFDNTQTFNNVTINLGSTSVYYYYNSFLEESDQTGAGTVLTLGSNVTINESGFAQIADSGYVGDRIVNQGAIKQSGSSSQLNFYGNCLTNSGTITGASIGGGLTIDDAKFTNYGTITAGSSGGTLTIEPTTFTNNGAINISNGDSVTIEPTNFTNAAGGVISVGANSSLSLTPGGSWSNLGSITLASGSSLYLGGSFTIAGLGSIANSGSTVYIEGTLNNSGGTLNGTTVLGQAALYGGTVQGGTATSSGLVLSAGGGTLSGVTYDGALNLSGPGNSVSLTGGTVVNNAAGTGAGTINDTSQGSYLYFDNTQTFNNATINLGAAAGYYSYLEEYDQAGAGTVLTLGSNVTVNESGYAQIADSGHAGDGIVNQGAVSQSGTGSQFTFSGNSLTNSGTITGASSGGVLTINDTTFTNSGTLAVSNGDTVTIEPTNFTNAAAGVISIGANSTLNMAPGGSWSNLGSITLASGSSLYLDISFTVASLGSITNSGGAVYIEGTFNNTGGTLNGTNVLGQAVLYGGTVQGGTAKPAGLAFSNHGGTLSGVTYDGALNLSGSGESVSLAGGTVVNNTAGTGAGTITDAGQGSYLYFDNTQTFNNAMINLGSTSGYYYNNSFLEEYDQAGAGTVLTLGSNVAVNESGYAQIADSGHAGDGIVNQGAVSQSGTGSQLTFSGNSLTNSGTITGASSGGVLTINDTTFTNSGTLAVSNGETVTIEPTTFTNLSGTTLTGGAFSVGAGSALELANNAKIATDSANITLSGAGSTIQSYNTTTNAQQLFDTTLRTISASGQLYLLANRSLTTAAAAITDNGLIQLGGGTLTVTGTGSSLTIGAAGELIGFGVVNATMLANSGVIEASGGTLTVQNAITGTGSLQIGDGATLVLGGSTASGASATYDGAGATLTLDNPASFAGTVGGVSLDDTLGLVGVTANGASVNGSNQLVVTDNGATVDTVQLSGSNSGFAFATQAVTGGTDVIALPVPATVAQYLVFSSLYDLISGGFAISDNAANISASLNALNDANINTISISDNGQIGVSAAELTSDAAAISRLANQNGSPYQLAVTDTAADIAAGLNGLNGSNIASITISDNGQIGVSVAELTSDATAISKLANQNGSPSQLAVTDTAADISAGLNGLNGANIASITISDNGAVGVWVAQLTSDATAIGKLANANGTPYQLAISGMAANVQADLASLEADVAHIASITLTSGTVVVSVSTFTADQSALDTIGGGFALSDTAANISASLNALSDANIASITISDNGAVGASIAQLTSDATAIGKLANANGTPYQLAISGMAANVQADLASLEADVAHIASITLTSGTVVVSVSTFTADQGALDTIVGGFALSDTAANISASLNALSDANIASITISDNGAVGASIAQLTSDATAIGKLANANGTPFQLAISGTAANVQADLANLEADVAHIASITLTSGTVVVSVSTFTADQGALDTIGGGFAISDTAANISASLNALNDANIASITISDNGAVGASVTQLTSDATAIGKLANANGTPYQLAISGMAANVQADLANLEADVAHIASITLTSGTVVVSVSTFTADQGALDTIIGGFAISDTAANISASLNALNDANIASITISDNGAVGASVAQLTSDATAIGKLANANGTPYQLAVTDTAADISAGLNGLNGSNIASITISDNGAVGVSVAQLTSDATAIGKLANANGTPYQLAISGTAANVQADLASLEADVAHIASIALTSGTVVVSVSTFTADQGALNKIVGGFAISDTAANISASLNALNDANIASITISDNGVVGATVAQLTSDATAIGKLANQNGSSYQLAVRDTAADISAGLNGLNGSNIASITISDNGAVGVSVAQLTSDATAIGKLANANGMPYQLAISGAAANVQADLASLEADVAHIASITLTSGTVVVSVSTFTADQGVLNKIVGGFAISDTAANISASLNALNGANIDAITISDNGVVGATVAQLTSNSTAIGKLVNAGGTPYQLAITDSLPDIVGGLNTVNSNSHVASLTATSGSATLSGGVGVDAPAFALTGSSIVLTVAENISYSGAFNEGVGSSVSISNADQLSLTGTASLGGTTSGAGTLNLAGGSATIEGGAKLSVSNLSISGSGTDVTLGEALTYSGSFSEGAGDTFVLSGGNLLLKGADTFAGGTVDGAKLLETEGTTTVSGLTIGGTVEWENTKTVTQTGTVTIGDSIGDKAFLYNTATGAYDITGAGAVGRGSSTASYIKNAGLFEKTGATGTSTIAPAVTNTGTLKVTSGTLDFMGAVTGKGIDTISGASTLEFDAAVASKTTVGDQNIGFTGGGTLDLTDPKAFWGEISGFATTDTVELLGSWAFSSFSENPGGTLATLTLVSGTTKQAFDFVGNYTQGDFKITSGATSTITHT